MISYKNRIVNPDILVRVYRNLNRKGVWYSVQQKGLVVGHTKNIKLDDVNFIVLKKGKERAIKTGVRNVHAFMEGYLGELKSNAMKIEKITYYPFSSKGFLSGGKEIKYAKEIIVTISGVFNILEYTEPTLECLT